MKELLNLGELYPSDFLKDGEEPSTSKVEMKLIRDDNAFVRLEKTAPLNKMYGKYWYRSGINNTMKKALKNVVDSIMDKQKLKENDIWLDIACNDGTLLSFVPKECIRIGIDPAEDSFKNDSQKHADYIVQDFFSEKAFNSVSKQRKAKVVTSIAMFYDVEKPNQFIKDIHSILDDDGIWVMQLSYTPLMIEQLAFDNICHEHIYYYSLLDIVRLVREQGFTVMDCELNDINGGSIRVYIKKDSAVNAGLADIGFFRVMSLLSFEYEQRYHTKWDTFFDKIKALKEQTVSYIREVKSQGKTVWGYGASTKGNTLLQYFELDNTLIDGIAERNRDKWGLRTIGTNIKIYSEDEMRKAKPDFLLILPWHFIKEFREREAALLASGTKMIVPCPNFEII